MNAVKVWLKANLFLVICGVVIVAALSGLYFLVSPMRDKLRDEETTALAVADQAATLDTAKVSLIPNKPQVNGPVVKWMIDAKKRILDQMKSQADQITALAATVNQKNRVVAGQVEKDGKKLDILIPLLGGLQQPGLLPVGEVDRGDPMSFKARYASIFSRWFAELCWVGATTPPAVPDRVGPDMRLPMDKSQIKLALPPTAAEITAAWELHKSDLQARETGRNAAGQAVGRVDQNLIGPAAQQKFSLEYLVARDGNYKMYGVPEMFQIRPLALSASAPNEKAIFEALIDVWIQQDIVNAIKAVNGKSTTVFNSPIKRLERIQVGAGVLTPGPASPSTDFFSAVPGGAAAAIPGEIFVNMASGVSSTAAPSGTDFNRSLTGRLGSASFDISAFEIVLQLDPAYLNVFLNELYRQNNGYTVLNMRIDAIDPFAAASNGYIYGKTSVIRVDITGEAMFFRDWTKKIMPPAIRAAVSPAVEAIPGTVVPGNFPTAAPPAAAPAGPPMGGPNDVDIPAGR